MMKNLSKSFIVGGLIGMAVSSVMEPMPEKTINKKFKFGMRKFLKAISTMKRMM
jgi:hypothetical protein